MTATQSNELLTEQVVAKHLSVSLACLRRWRYERRGPVVIHVGRLVRYRRSELEDWIARQPRGGEQNEASGGHRAEG
jgi:predicted DNA-binding transcriptional regulator AlpA